MATIHKKSQRDRHATPVIVTASGEVVAGKRRIEAFRREHPDARVVVSEMHHYAMVAGGYLRAARDEHGKLHLATQSQIDEHDWEEVHHEA